MKSHFNFHHLQSLPCSLLGVSEFTSHHGPHQRAAPGQFHVHSSTLQEVRHATLIPDRLAPAYTTQITFSRASPHLKAQRAAEMTYVALEEIRISGEHNAAH